MKLSSATSVLYHYPIQDAISLIKKAGYEGVDIWGGRPHVYRRDFSYRELMSIRSLIASLNMTVSSFMPAFYRYPHSLSCQNLKVRQDSINYMRECVENADILGAKIVLVVPDLTQHGQLREDSLKRFIESLDIISRDACQYEDIKLGIEILYTDETDFVNSSEDARTIIDELGHKNIGVVLDTGTLNLSKETPRAIFDNLPHDVLQIHVNDNDGGAHQQNLIPGEGTFDFPSLINFLQGINYCGFLSAELSKEYANNAEAALSMTAQRLNQWKAVSN